MDRRLTLHLLACIAALSLAIAPIACGDDEGEGSAGSSDTAKEEGTQPGLNGNTRSSRSTRVPWQFSRRRR